jgi:hypothetical protein
VALSVELTRYRREILNKGKLIGPKPSLSRRMSGRFESISGTRLEGAFAPDGVVHACQPACQLLSSTEENGHFRIARRTDSWSCILLPHSKEIGIYSELLDALEPVRHIALTVPFVAFVVPVTGRQRFIRFDGSSKILGADAIFIHAPANPDDQAIAGFSIEIAVRQSRSRWRFRDLVLFV